MGCRPAAGRRRLRLQQRLGVRVARPRARRAPAGEPQRLRPGEDMSQHKVGNATGTWQQTSLNSLRAYVLDDLAVSDA